jgi:hypothetical protein
LPYNSHGELFVKRFITEASLHKGRYFTILLYSSGSEAKVAESLCRVVAGKGELSLWAKAA